MTLVPSAGELPLLLLSNSWEAPTPPPEQLLGSSHFSSWAAVGKLPFLLRSSSWEAPTPPPEQLLGSSHSSWAAPLEQLLGTSEFRFADVRVSICGRPSFDLRTSEFRFADVLAGLLRALIENILARSD